ncbi:MAG TPA: AAA family ATPase [Gammaproteobacteria bacterium]|nr:AAA family ATPase [Gammaproteobacteria bacterium]
MVQVFIAIILMSFLLWSYNVLNRNFIAANQAELVKSPKANLFSLKRLFIIIILFLGCYTFISYAAEQAREEVIEEVRQDQMMQANNQINEQELIAMFEQSKNRGQERNKEIRVISPDEITTKFADVAGLAEAKDEVQDIVRFLQAPDDFSRLGAKAPKGVLLYGEPGTGKTLLARAIAGESKVSFIAVAGAEFDEEYIGVGASRVRKLFAVAREHAPCIIFIDEIDALAHKRNAQDPSWSAQTVNQLLAEMDGLDSTQNAGIVVIGASNRINAIDPAVLRPGRLDRHIKLDIPTLVEREEVLNVYLKKVKISPKVIAKNIAKMTAGFSSADLANLVNEAAILATKANKKLIEPADFEAAKDRIIMGSKREALKISEKTRKVTAYHEAGHALVGHLLDNHQPLYKVTITPRGQSLGHTAFEPKADYTSVSLQELEARIATMLAGRVAEEIVFGEQNITTGAESDLKHATDLAYNMVTRWGYSKRVGLIYNGADGLISADVIEEEVQAIIQRAYERAKDTLTSNRAQLNKIADALLERETIDGKELKQLLTPSAKTAA